MKKLLIAFLVFFSIIYIYIFTYDKKIYYFSITNNNNLKNEKEIANYFKNNNILETHVDKFNNCDNRIIDYIYMLNNNEVKKVKNKNISFKNALVKADVISIALIPNDQDFSNTYKTINYRNDLIKFIDKIREYSKEDIFVIGIDTENKDKIIISNIIKINNEIKEYCKIQKIYFIDFTENYSSSIIKQVKSTTLG